ncbi:hypothetical protein BgiBS90_010874 [Biomphalaria glabrata]|nr:hypothetical protein BgiBS90_010874 [Biomphalaria glabrata]
MNPFKMILPFILGITIASSNELAAVLEVTQGSQPTVYVLEENIVVLLQCRISKNMTNVEEKSLEHGKSFDYESEYFCHYNMEVGLSCERLKTSFQSAQCSSSKRSACTVKVLVAFGNSCPQRFVTLISSAPLNFQIVGSTDNLRNLFQCVACFSSETAIMSSTTSSLPTNTSTTTKEAPDNNNIVVAMYVCGSLLVTVQLVCIVVVIIVWRKQKTIVTSRSPESIVRYEVSVLENRQLKKPEERNSSVNADSIRQYASMNGQSEEYVELGDYNFPLQESHQNTEVQAHHENVDEMNTTSRGNNEIATNVTGTETVQNNGNQNNSNDIDISSETLVKALAELDTSML